MIYYRVSKPEQILYNSSGMISDMEDEIDIGPEVIHLYEVRLRESSATKQIFTILHLVSHFHKTFSRVPSGRRTIKCPEACCFNVSVCTHFSGGLKLLGRADSLILAILIWKQECIPVGCVALAHWPYLIVSARGTCVPCMPPTTHAPCHACPPATHVPLPCMSPPCGQTDTCKT